MVGEEWVDCDVRHVQDVEVCGADQLHGHCERRGVESYLVDLKSLLPKIIIPYIKKVSYPDTP